MEESNDLLQQRRAKLDSFEAAGVNPFANDFRVEHTAEQVLSAHADDDKETLETLEKTYRVGGRIMARRDFGKAAFLQLQDGSARIQLFVAKNQIGDEAFENFKKLDIGDIIGVVGSAFRTKTNELSLKASELRLLTKSLLPLPEKWHGLTDVETRYRQRYLDLIVNPEVRDVFRKRSQIINLIRAYMMNNDYLEVETPMLQPVAGGATAKPFVTHHNTLKMDLYLRIAPELYLKRLVVGGFDRVFEINRSFRNEGISIRHNPEFTMMEFYRAYATYADLMKYTEEMISDIAQKVCGSMVIPYGDKNVDLTPPWQRLTMKEAIAKYGNVEMAMLDDREKCLNYAEKLGLDLGSDIGHGKLLTEIFEEVAEQKLWEPTFITEYPTEVSPLSRKNDKNPEYVDRFELFVVGRELANAFSELNNPLDQKERFLAQLEEKAKGDDEAHAMDADYIRALEYGLPPTAGEGIGIDRLVMLLTNSPSIRDVLLFPQMRPEAG
jgi:lysyl-tRNA synthetase class 2